MSTRSSSCSPSHCLAFKLYILISEFGVFHLGMSGSGGDYGCLVCHGGSYFSRVSDMICNLGSMSFGAYMTYGHQCRGLALLLGTRFHQRSVHSLAREATVQDEDLEKAARRKIRKSIASTALSIDCFPHIDEDDVKSPPIRNISLVTSARTLLERNEKRVCSSGVYDLKTPRGASPPFVQPHGLLTKGLGNDEWKY